MELSSSASWNNRLRQERILRNWRQQDLADHLGTTTVTIKRWERGSQQPSAYFRVKLCALFGKSPEELFGEPVHQEQKEKIASGISVELPSDSQEETHSLTSNTLYLMRVIKDQTFQNTNELVDFSVDAGTKITAWLAAEGHVAYVIDSITISHKSPITRFISGRKSGAVVPDADYVFPIVPDSIQTYALNPALVLSHEDHQEVSFTLMLLPPMKEPDMRGSVNVVLHYHAFDGTQGKLYVRTPPEEGILLSQMLKTDIEVNGLIITPKGLQRGVDENSDREHMKETLSYKPITFPFREFLHRFFFRKGFVHSTSRPLPHTRAPSTQQSY